MVDKYIQRENFFLLKSILQSRKEDCLTLDPLEIMIDQCCIQSFFGDTGSVRKNTRRRFYEYLGGDVSPLDSHFLVVSLGAQTSILISNNLWIRHCRLPKSLRSMNNKYIYKYSYTSTYENLPQTQRLI